MFRKFLYKDVMYDLLLEMGVYRQKTTCLIHFQITSLSKKHLPQLTVNTSNLEEIMSRAYDSFDIQLSNLQLLYSKPGTFTDAKTINTTSSMKVYLLLP